LRSNRQILAGVSLLATVPPSPDMNGMDAPDPSTRPGLASRAPVHIGAVGLRVRDIDRMLDFYRRALGLTVLDRGNGAAKLGAGGVSFLELEHDPNARPDDKREAGLYHTAFLMPTRKELAQWLLQVARNHIPITGASDHGVSEAVYLDDPEGNGVEVYADRPPELWRWEGNLVVMNTDRLDVDSLLAEADPSLPYGAPPGLRVGHVHLRVGDIQAAENFYAGAIGLAITRRRGGATFLSSGRYHHHVAGNIWHSAGAGPRQNNCAGLAWFSIEAEDGERQAIAARLRAVGAPLAPFGSGYETADPWATAVRLVAP
jgi:catechol 2,3-dioxygenase